MRDAACTLASRSAAFRKWIAIFPVTDVPCGSAYCTSDSWLGNSASFYKRRKAVLSPKTVLFLLSNMVRAETTKSYVSVKRKLDVKSIKELTTRQKIIWIVFCLYLFISVKVDALTVHITAVL